MPIKATYNPLNVSALHIPAPYDPNSPANKNNQLLQLLGEIAPAAGTALGGLAGAVGGGLIGGLAGLPLGPGGAIIGGLGGAAMGAGLLAPLGASLGGAAGNAAGAGLTGMANQGNAQNQQDALKRQALMEMIAGLR